MGAIGSNGAATVPLRHGRRRTKAPTLTPFALSPPTVIARRSMLPVVLSIPHSGREYPGWLEALAVKGRAALEPLEDPLVDRLAWRALAAGVGAVVARAPRAAIDCNRSERDVDPATVEGAATTAITARARGGLGIVPGRTARHGFLWRRAIKPEELEARLNQAHRPYHSALAAAVEELGSAFGGAILLDCHSMPPRARNQAPIVLGTRHGESAGANFIEAAAGIVREAGFPVAVNHPYAGGWIVERHGAPERDVHAIQVEIDRSLYLDRDLASPGPGFDRVTRLLHDLASGLGAMVGEGLREAAE